MIFQYFVGYSHLTDGAAGRLLRVNESRCSESSLHGRNIVIRQVLSTHGFIFSRRGYLCSCCGESKHVGYRSAYLALIVLRELYLTT